MAVKVLIPSALRSYEENQESVEIDAETVDELLEKLVNRDERLRRLLYAEDGGLRSVVNVYVNDQSIRDLDSYQTPLENGDVVTLVLAIAGG